MTAPDDIVAARKAGRIGKRLAYAPVEAASTQHLSRRRAGPFVDTPPEDLAVTIERISRTMGVPLAVDAHEAGYLIRFQATPRLGMGVLSVLVHSLRRRGSTGILVWPQRADPPGFADAIATANRLFLAPLRGAGLHAGADFKGEQVRILVSDSEVAGSDNKYKTYFDRILRDHDISYLRHETDFMDSAAEAIESDLENILSGFYQKYAVAPSRRPSVTREIVRIFEAARKGGAFPASPVARPLDPKTTDWPTEKYSDSPKGEDIVAFLRRVWKPLIDRGATRADLRREDPSADRAILGYTSVRPDGSRRTLPGDVHLPTQKELNDRLLEAIPYSEEEIERLSSLLRQRRRDRLRR